MIVSSCSNQKGPNQWIDDLRHSLADIVVRGEWEDLGIFRLMNRVSFMSSRHLFFAMFRDEGEKDGIRSFTNVSRITAFDPVFEDRAWNSIKKEFICETIPKGELEFEYKSKENKLKNYRIRLFDTDIFFVIVELKILSDEPRGKEPDLEFRVLNNTSNVFDFFVEVFMPFEELNETVWRDESLRNRLRVLRERNAYKIAASPEPSPDILNSEDLDLIARLTNPIYEHVNREYLRLRKSPALRSFGAVDHDQPQAPANVFLFAKIFCRRSLRYGHYEYDPIFLASENQVADICAHLARANADDFIEYGIKKYDELFWRWALDASGRERIIAHLTGEWPSHIRLFTENVLMSGSTMIKPNIFRRGGIGWIDDSDLDDNHKDQAFMRLVCLHYVMQLSAPKRPVDCKALSIVSYGFRTGGAVWVCASYVRENGEGEIPGLIDQAGFYRDMLIYHSLFRESERRLRTKARGMYITALSYLAAIEVKNTKNRHGIYHLPLSMDEKSIKDFNKKSNLLTRIYPYPEVALKYNGNKLQIPFNKITLIRMANNSYFDRLTLREFIDDSDIKQRIEEALVVSSVKFE